MHLICHGLYALPPIVVVLEVFRLGQASYRLLLVVLSQVCLLCPSKDLLQELVAAIRSIHLVKAYIHSVNFSILRLTSFRLYF